MLDFEDDDAPDNTQALRQAQSTDSAAVREAKESLNDLDIAAGLADLEGSGARVQVGDKYMINARADLNQLVPFKYDWAWQKYLDGCANHWMPQEINMGADVLLWNDPKGLTEAERRIIKRNLGFFSTADSLVANNLVLAVYRLITNPECRQYILRQAFEEAIHCYIDGTEILTENGFVDFRDLKEGVRVAQWHENGDIDFVLPDEILHDRYTGQMFEFRNESGSYNKVVTPQHRCVVSDPRDGDKIKIKLAKDFSPRNYSFPVVGGLVNADARVFDALDAFQVAYQADGTIRNKHVKDKGAISGTVDVVFTFSKQRKVDRVLALASQLDFWYSTTALQGENKGQTQVSVKVPREIALTKDFSHVDLREVDVKWIDAFVAEVSVWDGHRRQNDAIVYTNTNEDAVLKVQELGHIGGYRTGLYTTEASGSRVESYQLYIYSSGKDVAGRSIQKTELHHDGHVHCVGVPTGMIVTRYKGAVAVSGNTHAYQYCIESLGMDEGEIFNMYHEIPSVAKKAAWGLKYTQEISDPKFETGTPETDRAFLKNLIAYYCVLEGVFFYCGFSQILSMGRRNKMIGVAEQFQYILRDESMHLNFGIDVINQIKNENPSLWDAQMQHDATLMILQGTQLEIEYAYDTMPEGVLGMNAEVMESYLKFIANRRLAQIGLPEQYPGATNPFPWMAEIMDLKKEKNFFESRKQICGLAA